MSANTTIDPAAVRAARAFLGRLSDRYSVSGALVYGSRARQGHNANSDLDLAVLLSGRQLPRVDVALDMAAISFDVLMETDILVEALPLWEDEWAHPETFSNPALIENIRRDGVRI